MSKKCRTEFKKYSDNYNEFDFIIVHEDNQNQISKAEVYLEGFKVKNPKPPVTPDMKKILSAIEGLTSKVDEMKSDIDGMKSDINEMKSEISEIKSDMLNMKQEIKEVKIDISNLKVEMNDRFDKLETRVSILEGFHKKDLDKK